MEQLQTLCCKSKESGFTCVMHCVIWALHRKRVPMFTSSSLQAVLATILINITTSAHAQLPKGFEDLTHSQKCAILLTNVMETPLELDPKPTSFLGAFGLISSRSLMDTFSLYINNEGHPHSLREVASRFMSNFSRDIANRLEIDRFDDEMPVGRDKEIHRKGTTAGVEAVAIGNHPLTGMFQTGAQGLIRLSQANPDLTNFAPGMALKFPISNAISANAVAMYRLTGQGNDLNFFRNVFSTRIPMPPAEVMTPAPGDSGGVRAKKFFMQKMLGAFHTVVESLRSMNFDIASEVELPINEFAASTQNGPILPTEVRGGQYMEFAPSAELTAWYDRQLAEATANGTTTDFVELFNRIPVGTALYQATVVSGNERHVVWELRTTTAFRASDYQNRRLRFRHQRGLPRLGETLEQGER